jgi:hypothetical protein
MAKQLTDAESRPAHEDIAKLAYSIFEKNGKAPGRDIENWLEAERQLQNSNGRPATHANSTSKNPARPATRTVLSHRA